MTGLARFLVEGRRPSQVALRRATSTIYYALFHAMASNCANMLVGSAKASRSRHAWLEVYRSLAHGTAKSACEHRAVMDRFPDAIIDFANAFVEFQEKRHSADYDPGGVFRKSRVVADIGRAEIVMKGLAACPRKDRVAFASWVLFRNLRRN